MAKGRGNEAGFAELVMQARITNRLLAAQLKATVGQQDLVNLLHGTGASNQEIADVLGTTAATVATTLQRLKRKLQAKESSAAPDQKLLGARQAEGEETERARE